MRRFGVAAAVLAAGVLAMPVRAADNVQTVQSEVERALERLTRLDPDHGLSHGAVEVLRDGTAFRVTVADLAVKLAANDPGQIDVGFVSFRLMPQPGHLYRVDEIQLAEAVPHRDADGRVDGTWRLDNRELSGLWSRQQGGFLRRGAAVDVSLVIEGFDAVLDGIASAPPQQGSNLRRLQLLLFRGLAARHTAADGTIVDRYDLRLDPDGTVALNGRVFDRQSATTLSLQ